MNDPSPFDELLSAHLDGETDADEAARIGADPSAPARAQALRAASEAIGAPVEPPPATVRDAAVAAALAAAPSAVSTEPTVRSLDDARRARQRRQLRVLSAAAAVLVAALAVPLLLANSDDDDAGVAGDVAAPFAEEADRASGGGAGAATTTMAMSAMSADLGAIDDEGALVAALSAQRFATADSMAALDDTATEGDESAPAAGSTAPADACLSAAEDAADALGPVFTATATYQGEPVVIYVFDTADGPRAVAVAVDGCITRAEVALPE
jgi:hypothetical protein